MTLKEIKAQAARYTKFVEWSDEDQCFIGGCPKPNQTESKMKTFGKAVTIATITVLLFAAGCATPYQPAGFSGGYSDTALAPDVYRVVFHGNGYTSPERVQDMVLLQAAELTVQHGFTCFALLDENNTTTTSSFTTPGHAYTDTYGSGNLMLNQNGNSYYGSANLNANSFTTYTPPQTYTFYKPNSGLLIRCYNDKPNGVYTLDAAFLMQSLGAKYKIKHLNIVTPNSGTGEHLQDPIVKPTANAPQATPDWAQNDASKPLELYAKANPQTNIMDKVDTPAQAETPKQQVIVQRTTIGSMIYAGTGVGHWIQENIDDGAFILLEDGSLWKIDPFDKIDASLWLPLTDITVAKSSSGSPGYDYLLINTEDKETAHAKYTASE